MRLERTDWNEKKWPAAWCMVYICVSIFSICTSWLRFFRGMHASTLCKCLANALQLAHCCDECKQHTWCPLLWIKFGSSRATFRAGLFDCTHRTYVTHLERVMSHRPIVLLLFSPPLYCSWRCYSNAYSNQGLNNMLNVVCNVSVDLHSTHHS